MEVRKAAVSTWQLALLFLHVAEKLSCRTLCLRGRLHIRLKSSVFAGFVSGHNFSRADQSFNPYSERPLVREGICGGFFSSLIDRNIETALE